MKRFLFVILLSFLFFNCVSLAVNVDRSMLLDYIWVYDIEEEIPIGDTGETAIAFLHNEMKFYNSYLILYVLRGFLYKNGMYSITDNIKYNLPYEIEGNKIILSPEVILTMDEDFNLFTFDDDGIKKIYIRTESDNVEIDYNNTVI